MSRVMLIAADKPLPLCDKQEERSVVSRFEGEEYRFTCRSGFCVREHTYYRPAVDDLGYEIKPFQYELDLEKHETDLKNLLDYLREHFIHGETVELWSLWVGGDREEQPVRYRGALSDFDLDTLEQFLTFYIKDNKLSQCCMTITI